MALTNDIKNAMLDSGFGTGASLAGAASIGLGVGSNPAAAVSTAPAVSGWRLPAGAAPWRPGPAGLRLRVR